jgi:DNA-binding NarL/FixJ family response regulator
MDQAAHEAWEELVAAAQRRLAQARTLLRSDAEAAEREIAVAERLLTAALSAWVAPDSALRDPDAPFVADGSDFAAPLVEPLTPREVQVLHLLAEGLRNKEIALRIGVSERTATFHVGNVLGKLGADSRTEAVHFARRRRLIRD